MRLAADKKSFSGVIAPSLMLEQQSSCVRSTVSYCKGAETRCCLILSLGGVEMSKDWSREKIQHFKDLRSVARV